MRRGPQLEGEHRPRPGEQRRDHARHRKDNRQEGSPLIDEYFEGARRKFRARPGADDRLLRYHRQGVPEACRGGQGGQGLFVRNATFAPAADTFVQASAPGAAFGRLAEARGPAPD